MKKEIILFVLTLISYSFLISCGEFIPPEVEEISISTDLKNIKISYILSGNSNLDYRLELRYKNQTIHSSITKDEFASHKKIITIPNKEFKEHLLEMLFNVNSSSSLSFDLIVYNSSKNYRYDTTLTVIPQIVNYPKLDLLNNTIAETNPLGINDCLFEVREYLNEKKYNKKIDTEDISLKLLHLYNETVKYDVDNETNIPIYNSKKNIFVNLQNDQNFDFNFIFLSNKADLKTLEEQFASLPIEEIPNNCKIKTRGKLYELSAYLSTSKDSCNDITDVVYFGMNKNGERYTQNIGMIIIDNVSPSFSSYNWRSFNNPWDASSESDNKIKYKHDKYKGSVTLTTKQFQGWSPYNVPFVGHVYGDVNSLYVNGVKRNFKIGKELYFKQKIYLDHGYNRIPIKIVDKRGNTNESYIEITITDVKDNEININNEINIDNN